VTVTNKLALEVHGLADAVKGWAVVRHDEVLAELSRWVAQPSVSRTGQGMKSAAKHGARLLRRCGLEVEVLETPGWPALVGTAPGRPGSPHILIYGHYDVQPPGPLDHWVSPPFRPEIRDGRMYGRGTADNKGQHLAQLFALQALRDLTGDLPCRVSVLLDGEEEIGSPHLPQVVAERFVADPPDLVIWSDGPVHETGQACIVLGVRGIITFTLRARGPVNPLHSGNWGGVAPNPAWKLVHLLASMRDAQGNIAVEGFADAVEPLSPGEQAALDALPVDVPDLLDGIGVTEMEPPPNRSFYERLTVPTFTINSLSCSDAGDHRTVVPSVAVARCDVRLVGQQKVDDVIASIRRHIDTHAPGVEFELVGAMPPSRTMPESRWTDAVMAGTEVGLGEKPLLVPALGGSLPLAAFTDILGVPCYGIPFGNIDERNHAPNENLELNWYLRGISASAAVHASIAAAGRG
jgi:acetylornithine deacetylase/succinyl-diaminopimelate desuccinylase-like protein